MSTGSGVRPKKASSQGSNKFGHCNSTRGQPCLQGRQYEYRQGCEEGQQSGQHIHIENRSLNIGTMLLARQTV